MKPCFMTIFPQNGKTYCLISYFKKYRNDFKSLQDLSDSDEVTKMTIISNLITIYTENFVVKPDHWQNLSNEKKKKYFEIYERSMLPQHRNFTFDHTFSLFA